MPNLRNILPLLLSVLLLIPTTVNVSASQQIFDGGYIDMSKNLKRYIFYTHDYQGNVRVAEDMLGLNVERYDYYPYGALFGEKSPSQNYLYGGKEWERSYGMNHYDFLARWMNPLTTRFTTQDSLQLDFAELSSYSYCAGNPILYIDPSGKFWETFWDIGNLIYDVGAAVDSHIRGYHDKATEHWIDAGVDLAATLIPFVPAGGSKLARMADDVVDATYDASKTADNVTDASNAINKVADATKNVDNVNSEIKIFQSQNNKIVKNNITFVQGYNEKATKITIEIPNGYKKINQQSHGMPIFYNGKNYISPDRDGHNGGVWKKANKINELNNRNRRLGTFDKDLNKIGK